jgi:hypothetical protein
MNGTDPRRKSSVAPTSPRLTDDTAREISP